MAVARRHMLNETQLLNMLVVAHNNGGSIVIEETDKRCDYTIAIPGQVAERHMLADGTILHVTREGLAS